MKIQTLRYYERRGLLPAPERSNGGHRRYSPDTIVTLRAIKAAQRLGFTLQEVTDLLRPTRTAPGLHERAVGKLAEVQARIADLHTIRADLAATVEAGCDDLLTCAASTCCPIPVTVPVTVPVTLPITA